MKIIKLILFLLSIFYTCFSAVSNISVVNGVKMCKWTVDTGSAVYLYLANSVTELVAWFIHVQWETFEKSFYCLWNVAIDVFAFCLFRTFKSRGLVKTPLTCGRRLSQSMLGIAVLKCPPLCRWWWVGSDLALPLVLVPDDPPEIMANMQLFFIVSNRCYTQILKPWNHMYKISIWTWMFLQCFLT